jgi:carbamoyltransferase
MKILGISAYYHDSAACLIEGEEILAAAQEERFTRLKQDESFPVEAIKYCLQEAALNLEDLDAIVFYDKPFLKFERLIETYYNTAPRGLWTFVKAIPIWLKEKLFLKSTIKKALQEIGSVDFKKTPLLFSAHHLSHAASAFYVSPFEESAILTIDGVGEWATASIALGKGNQIAMKAEMHFPDSLGLLYSSFTYFLGFKVNSGEYKLMGLAPYGNPDDEETNRYIQIIKEELVTIFENGSIVMNQAHFKYMWGLRMIKEKSWERLFGFPTRLPETPLRKQHFNLALAIQMVTEEIVLLMAKHAKQLTGSNKLCLSGGVALNCVANGKLNAEEIFEEIYIQPAAGDAGGALGAAFAVLYMHFGLERTLIPSTDKMQGAYLGPYYNPLQIRRAIERIGANYREEPSQEKLLNTLVEHIAAGDAIGFFQGRMEFGPRALGNRSILADPRNPEIQKKLNLKIKQRESFRPFAPVLLEEELQTFFEHASPSPYMLLVNWFKTTERNKLPTDYFKQDLSEMLYYQRTKLPAVTHIDFSARLQTVTAESNPVLHDLLKRFKAKTGVGVLVNTSFNLRGEPIVCSPEDALKTFFSTEMDVLCMENFILLKVNQDKKIQVEQVKTIED